MPKVTIVIAGTLRARGSGAASVSLRAGSVKQALAELTDGDAEFANRLFLPDGGLRRTVVILVSGQNVRFADGLDTPLRDGDEIVVLSAVTGG